MCSMQGIRNTNCTYQTINFIKQYDWTSCTMFFIVFLLFAERVLAAVPSPAAAARNRNGDCSEPLCAWLFWPSKWSASTHHRRTRAMRASLQGETMPASSMQSLLSSTRSNEWKRTPQRNYSSVYCARARLRFCISADRSTDGREKDEWIDWIKRKTICAGWQRTPCSRWTNSKSGGKNRATAEQQENMIFRYEEVHGKESKWNSNGRSN